MSKIFVTALAAFGAWGVLGILYYVLEHSGLFS